MLNLTDIEIAISTSTDPVAVKAVSQYAKYLEHNNLPVIYSGQHFAQLVGIEIQYLYAVANSSKHFYRSFKIKKKNGGCRKITAPLPVLMVVQSWILKNILNQIPVHKACKAYIKNIGIRDNARLHRKAGELYSSDVVDFFGSLRKFQVQELFFECGYSKALSVLFANLCCYDNYLPQGAPTSGYLSNLILRSFDSSILKYSRENGLVYTRYADDISISGSKIDVETINAKLIHELANLGLKLNFKKTRLSKKNNRQSVTGVIVNEKLNVPREFLREIKQEYFFIMKYGLLGHANYIKEENTDYILERLIGRYAHAIHIRPYDKKLIFQKSELLKLKKHSFR